MSKCPVGPPEHEKGKGRKGGGGRKEEETPLSFFPFQFGFAPVAAETAEAKEAKEEEEEEEEENRRRLFSVSSVCVGPRCSGDFFFPSPIPLPLLLTGKAVATLSPWY